MSGLNEKINTATLASREAKSTAARELWEATNPGFGLDERAVGTMIGGSLPKSSEPSPMQLDALASLRGIAKSKEKEVSLDTLTPEQLDKIKQSFINCRGIADKHYTSVIEPEVQHRRAVYNADRAHYASVFPTLSEQSNWVSKDVKASCEWILPGLMEVFTGGDDPLSVKGVLVDDDDKASKIQQLIRYQLEKKNDYYHFCLAELSIGLAENFAVAKVWWEREEKRTKREFMLDINDAETHLWLVSAWTAGKIDILGVTEIEDAPDFLKVEYEEIELKKNHPVLEYLPNSELRYTPDAPSLQDCKFVAHRKVVRGDYLKRKENQGVYKDVMKAIREFGEGNTNSTVLETLNDRDRANKHNRPSDNDEASKEVELYEAYLQVDYNNDGVFENLIVHAVGDNIIRVAENDIGFPPMFVCSAIYDPNAVFSRHSIADNLEEYQDLKTATIRQIIINMAKNNSPRTFVDHRKVDMDALMANEEIISSEGDPSGAVYIPPQLPLSSVSMEMVQYAQNEIENQSGSTRYNQGLDSNSLNSTATGITAIMGASEKRNKLMARSIAEKFFIPIYKLLILLNQKYLEDEQMIRLTNENVAIRKDDLDIDYDLIVNVGVGAGTNEAQIQYLMLTLNQIYPMIAGQGIVNSKSWYNLVKKLLERLGLRDVGQYLLDPESPEAQQAAMAAQQAQAQAQAQALQNSLQLSIAKSSVPRVNLNLNDLPVEAQAQYIKDKFGVDVSEREVAEHEVLRHGE